MCRFLVYGLGMIMLAVPTSAVSAQVPLATGDRVRVSAPALAPVDLVGTLTDLRDDTLVVTVPWRERPIDVPLSSVSSLQRAWGYQTRTVRGTLIGAALGFVAGALAFDDDEVGEGAFAVAGGVVGGVIGSRIRAERWRPAPMQTRWIIGASVRF